MARARGVGPAAAASACEVVGDHQPRLASGVEELPQYPNAATRGSRLGAAKCLEGSSRAATPKTMLGGKFLTTNAAAALFSSVYSS